MSVIQRIRDKAAWFVFGAIALSLIAFILQDAFSRNKGGNNLNSADLGVINGVSITRQEFESKLSFYQQANGTPREKLMPDVWDYMVDQTVMQQAYELLGLKYTSKELSDAMFGDTPPSWLQQAFTDPATGAYNPDQARQLFADLKKNPNEARVAQIYTGYIEPSIQQSLRQKYQSLITGAVYVPKWMAEKTNADNNSLAKISYINVPYNTINDSSIKVTDEDINAFIKKHPKQFEQKEEIRQIAYVNFDASASAEDSAALINQLNLLKKDFAASADAKAFLSKNGTELPYYDSYIGRTEIKQTVKDSLFNLSTGSLYGPYLDGGNYVVAKLVGEKQMPDSVKVRHILLATHQQQENGSFVRVRDDSSAYKRLDSAIALINAGADFDSVCAKYSEDPGSKDKGGIYDYFSSGKMVEEFNDFAFGGKPGEKKLVHTAYGYHYIEILGQKGGEPAYKIAYLAKPIVASQETINAANSAATQFAAANQDKKLFDAAAAKLNMPVLDATEVKQNDNSIPTIGEDRELVKWIYNNQIGDVSEPFQVDEKYIVAVITGVSKAGLKSAAAARPVVEPQVRNEKKAQQIINTKIKGTTLEAIASGAGVAVQTADSVSFQGYLIPNLGNEVKILGAAFNKQLQGKVSAPIAGNTGIIVVRGEGIFAGSSLNTTPEMLRVTLESQLKSQVGYRSMTALKDAADIKDYRSTFY